MLRSTLTTFALEASTLERYIPRKLTINLTIGGTWLHIYFSTRLTEAERTRLQQRLVMSFIGGGAECGPVNPLAQISKHSQQDRSLQRDRLEHKDRPGVVRGGMREQQGSIPHEEVIGMTHG